MKLIEALKKKKELLRKADDLRNKVSKYCAHMSFETPTYPEQKKQVEEWIQSHHDVIKEIEHLQVSVQNTNLKTPVTIEIGGKTVTKPIAAWILRRRELSQLDLSCWQKLTDRNLKEGVYNDSQQNKIDAKITRCYDPVERDKKVELYRTEPTTIDSTLETVNATTDLIEVEK